MPILTLMFDRAATSRVDYTSPDVEETHGYLLAEGETAEEYAPTAAQSICDAANARLGLSGEDAWVPAESYALTEEEQVLQIYLNRAGPSAGPAQRVIARWAAFNHLQLAAGREGWTQEAIAGLLATPRCKAVVGALTTFGWGLAADTLAAATTADHELATPDVVAAYLDAMDAEGALPA